MQARLESWTQETYDNFLDFVKRCFAQKRKNLLNNLEDIYARSRIMQALQKAGKSANTRAEQVSLEDMAGMFEQLTRTT